mmetsp:Transcript_15845/g.26981  ORF Transcript_15845/g.26981 Transcript_15845/m.26981 type:complete len:92 (+) Transcript_15845:138-413(+)
MSSPSSNAAADIGILAQNQLNSDTPPLQVKNQNLLHEEMSMNPSNMKPITAAKAATLILPMDPPHRLRSRQLLACALVEWGMSLCLLVIIM